MGMWGTVVKSIGDRVATEYKKKGIKNAKTQMKHSSAENRRLQTGAGNTVQAMLQPQRTLGGDALARQSQLMGFGPLDVSGWKNQVSFDDQGEGNISLGDQRMSPELKNITDPQAAWSAMKKNKEGWWAPTDKNQGSIASMIAKTVMDKNGGQQPVGLADPNAAGAAEPVMNSSYAPTAGGGVKQMASVGSSPKMDPTQAIGFGNDADNTGTQAIANGVDQSGIEAPGSIPYANEDQPYDNGSINDYLNPETFQLDPSYGFVQDQGFQAIGRNATAGGLGQGGSRLKDAMEFATGLASTEYGNAWERSRTSNLDQWNRLQDLVGGGTRANEGSVAGVLNTTDQIQDEYDKYYGARANANLAQNNAEAQHHLNVSGYWGDWLSGGMGGGKGGGGGGADPTGGAGG